jgi:hypothetical protein
MAELGPGRGQARPILVTGTHRSGTTWVGEMLALSPTVHYVHEPFAPMYERSWVRSLPAERYLHVPPGARGPLDEDLARIVALRPPWLAIARRAGGVRNAVRLTQEMLQAQRARRRGARALIKDPFALLLAEWLATRADAAVVVLVRHPAAFVGSVKRLGWRLDVRWLLQQPSLMDGDLQGVRAELERDRDGANDVVDHAALVWRALNTVVARYETQYPDWIVSRYEDLAADPAVGVGRLCRNLDIPWSSRLEGLVREHNAPRHGVAVEDRSMGGTQRDSQRAMWTWANRLTPDEIERVRVATAPLSTRWYSDDDWVPPR